MAKISGPITKCEKCGGPLWDNRDNKKTPKSPDYKCKDKSCGEAFWLDKPKPSAVAATDRAVGDLLRGTPKWTWASLSKTYERSLKLAAKHVPLILPKATPADVVAAGATIFICATRDGVEEPPTKTQEIPASEEDDSFPY